MGEVDLSAGTIEYDDSGGDGPIVVLLHGVTMDGTLWRNVVAELREDHRCVVPTLPLGAHRRPMRPDAAQSLRMKALRRLPVTFGWMSKRPVPDEIMDGWLRPMITRPEIRRDLRKYVSGVKQAKRELLAATEKLSEFERPALVAWAREDRVMPVEHGRRLAELLPRGRLVEISDSYTLIPEDQPRELATHIREFIAQEAIDVAA